METPLGDWNLTERARYRTNLYWGFQNIMYPALQIEEHQFSFHQAEASSAQETSVFGTINSKRGK